MAFAAHSYEGVASFYDELASLYSLGRIDASKRCQIELLEPGERVLFAGVGRGRDALAAARRGAEVTAVDLSPRMLARFQADLDREGLSATVIRGDIAEHRAPGGYDTVVAHYFLNLYDETEARQMLAVLIALTRPGGRIFVADFAPGEGSRIGRWLTALYYHPLNWIAWALGYCALHPILVYPELVEGTDLRIQSTQRFPLFGGLADPAYLALRAERVGPGVD